jgi:hypothetical protein
MAWPVVAVLTSQPGPFLHAPPRHREWGRGEVNGVVFFFGDWFREKFGTSRDFYPRRDSLPSEHNTTRLTI